MKSFEYINSDKFKETDDYRICRHLLKSLLSEPPNNELEIALKRLFHRNLYNDYKKIALIDYVLKTHSDYKISVIDFTKDNHFYTQLCSAYNRPLKYIENIFIFSKRLFLKTFSAAFFLRIVAPYKIRFKTERGKTSVLITTYCKQPLFAGIYKKLTQKFIAVDFLMMEKDVSSEYESDFNEGTRYFQKSDMVCSYKLLHIIFIAFLKFYIKAIRLKDIELYKNIFVFMQKYFMYICIFENILPEKVFTFEDYPEFNPRYFAAKNNCEIVNILPSKIVPSFNPYLSFCLIDREISFTSKNLNIRRKSGCQVRSFTQLNNFDGFLGFMQENYDNDIKEITKLVKKAYTGTNTPKVITYFSSGGEHNFAYIDMPVKTKMAVLSPLRRYLINNNDIVLIIKPHPGETNKTLFDKEYHDFFDLPNVIVLDKEISAYTLLQYSDLNIAATSTMGTHSKYFNLNTIVANLLNINVLFEEGERENSFNYRYVTTEEELFSAIKELTTKEKRYLEGKNNRADTFIDEISQLITQNPPGRKGTISHKFTMARIQC